MTWHVNGSLLSAYLDGSADAVAAASVEMHVVRCAGCRAALAAAPGAREGLDLVWGRVRDAVELPEPSLVERVARHLRATPSDARLLAATPSLTPSWFLGLVLVTGLALLAALHGGEQSIALFLLVAPLAPVLGVGVAFGPAVDPSHEVVAATPYPALRLLMLRSCAVVATSLPVVAVAAALVPGPSWVAVGWLLPSLAFSLAVLGLSAWVPLTVTAATISMAWAGAVVTAAFLHNAPVVLAPGVQPLYLLLAVAAGALLVIQAHRMPRPEGGPRARHR